MHYTVISIYNVPGDNSTLVVTALVLGSSLTGTGSWPLNASWLQGKRLGCSSTNSPGLQ